MRLLYLRHGDDRGTDIYRHDRQLNDRGRKKARKAFGELAKKYGHPDTVFVSPFRRSLRTLEEIATQFKRPVDIHRDPRIAQYVGSKKEPLVSPETAAVIAFAKRRARIGSSIWCITHQTVIEEVTRCFGMKIPGDLDFLDHVVMLG